ncbi:MAG: efflux RND transporter periplasmic adaptor subunit [Candidatus Thiodiazotropha sp.]
MLNIQRPAVAITGLALAGVVTISTAGLFLRYADPASTEPNRPIVLSVEARPITLQKSFIVKQTFSGQVQPRRRSELGFESSGRLVQVCVDEGSHIESGQLLARLDTQRPTAQRNELLAAQAKAEANLALADVTLRRMSRIIDKGGVSRQGLDEARETQRVAKAALALAKQRIITIDIELEKAQLVAPYAATVILRSADEGQVLNAGQAILTLQERTAPEIRVGIAGRSLEQLKPGNTYPARWKNQTIMLKLRALLPLRTAATRTVDALFDPLDPPTGMLAGDLITLNLDSQVAQRGSWLPLGALTEGERGLWSVYVATPLDGPSKDSAATHRIVRHTVDLLYQSTNRVFVRGALKPSQQVVTTGLQRIVPNQQVRIASVSRTQT